MSQQDELNIRKLKIGDKIYWMGPKWKGGLITGRLVPELVNTTYCAWSGIMDIKTKSINSPLINIILGLQNEVEN